MRLFGYYALHSMKNQIKKLFKSAFLVFILVCALMGGLIGFGAAMLDEATAPEDEIVQEEQPEEDLPEEELPREELYAVLELLAGGIILAVFVVEIIGADKNGSKIFLPADVALLFPSPMKPQSVLLFRLMTQLGVVILSSAYLMFQLPNLVINMGLGVWGAVGILATWILTIAIGKLIQILCYTIASTNTKVKKYLRKGLYGMLAVLAGAFLLYTNASGLDYYAASKAFFNHPITRWIPLWGWLKGLCMYAMEGNLLGAVLSAVAVIASGAGLAVVIWRIKADFYEDAMAKSEETAQLLEAAQSENSAGFVKRKKDRSEKLRRDGMKHGSGANVFFFRSMYNRFRFAHFGVFTKTSETYLVLAAFVSVLCRFVLEVDLVLPVVLSLSGFVFFRALGNPLAEDTSKDFFRLIPESTGKKLLWSMLGGTVNCLMDLLPALVVAACLGTNPLLLLAWIPFVLSVDFYATNVTTFIDVAVSSAAGKMVKQLIAILFIYFGLLPDVVILILGFVFGNVALAAIGAAAVNFALGGLFLCLTPLFIDAKDKPYRQVNELSPENRALAKKHFSTMGLACFVIITVSTVLQILFAILLPELASEGWTMWLFTFAPIYLVAVPLGVLVLRSVPKRELEKSKMKVVDMVKSLFISIFLMYAGNLLGILVTEILTAVTGKTVESGVATPISGGDLWMRVLVMVILAPIIEEFLFRKLLIDRMSRYGEKLAVVLSALMFGLFHGNFSQFFYAFFLGLLFGYVYLKSGKLRYSIGLHMFINLLGSVVSVGLLGMIDLEALDAAEPDVTALIGVLLFLGYTVFMIVSAIVGLVLFCRSLRKVQYETAELEIPKGSRFKLAYLNVGMILFSVACLALFVLSIL